MGLLDTYYYYNTEMADPRTKDWPLMSSPIPVALLTFSYLYFVLRCGRNYMEKRPAYSLKTFVRVYNLFQVVVNALFVYQVFNAGWLTEIGITCYPYSYSYEPNSLKMASITWWVMCVKLLDYSETFVFILRKKSRQISFLHLYHHVSTVGISWMVTKYYAGGMSMFFIIVNCSIHVVMYTYYFASSFGPSVQAVINPIKPFITIAQMVQFWVLIVYSLQAFIPGCPTTEFLAALMLGNLLMNFILFYSFYKQSYTHTKTK